jgi:hypothetical protein
MYWGIPSSVIAPICIGGWGIPASGNLYMDNKKKHFKAYLYI